MGHRKRRDLATIRRRVEGDEDEDESHIGILDDDSFSEDSTLEEDSDNSESNQSLETGCASLIESPKINGRAPRQRNSPEAEIFNGHIESQENTAINRTTNVEISFDKLNSSNKEWAEDEAHFDMPGDNTIPPAQSEVRVAKINQFHETPYERRRREHLEYKRRRDEDPSFVPNRGAFFMHDYRHSGPAANGFRPSGRGRDRGRLRAGTTSISSNHPGKPLDGTWTHDMHDTVTGTLPQRDLAPNYENGGQSIINRTSLSVEKAISPSRALSVTKFLGKVHVRVALPTMPEPMVFWGIPVKQYTRLPEHRPPLRRDKPVRISLPNHSPRHIFPAVDRSFIFIPRAMRPNQQGFRDRGRGRGRSGFGSTGGYSRRTSVFGGSIYGSAHSPSVAISRHSSLVREYNRDISPSPAASVISRPPILLDPEKPVVRLPPPMQGPHLSPVLLSNGNYDVERNDNKSPNIKIVEDSELSQISPTQDKSSTPQPVPKAMMSLSDKDSPIKLQFNPPQQQQQPFHQQVPTQVNGNLTFSHQNMIHNRNIPYHIPISTGTSLPQIPERAIHAQPFQPNPYQPPQPIYSQPIQVMHHYQGYYYTPNLNSGIPPLASASPYTPIIPQSPHPIPLTQLHRSDNVTPQAGVQSLVAQEVNGMVYYYDAAHIPAIASFSTYQPSHPVQQVGMAGIGGALNPNPSDGFYYAPAPQNIMYYPQ
ncbi:hypothetical protein K3495_g12565 [Podosphaera aphanis]|nr:hypothetical protein K3495_g12565 [Podosphaera aphanis]